MNNIIFPTEAERQEAIDILRGLQEMPYWKFFVNKIIEPEIKEIEDMILDGDYEGDSKELKTKRKYLKHLIDLPTLKITELSEIGDTDEPDPYETETKRPTKMTR